ncbi:MAG: chaperone NapD [Halioglobus sp.]
MKVSRRQLLSGRSSAPQYHIASMVVQCLPENVARVSAAIESLQSTQVPARDNSGKLVVLLEMARESDLLDRIHEIEAVHGVISANLAFHQLDDQPNEQPNDQFNDKQADTK